MTAILALTALCVVALVVSEARGALWGRWVFKLAASAAFVWLGVAAGGLDSVYGRLILAALVASALGDAALIMDQRAPFLAGMAAFAFAHLFYLAALLSQGIALTPASLATVAALSIALAGIYARLRPHLGEMRHAVLAYVGIIGAMTAAALAGAFLGGSERLIAAAAAVLFAISDIAVARDRFVAPSWLNRLWGLPLYYLAQCLFALSI